MTKEEVTDFVRDKCIKNEQEKIDEILESWQDANDFLHKLETDESEAANNNNTFDLNSDLIKQIEQTQFINRSSSKPPKEFKWVEIDTLIAVQRKIFLDHVDKLDKIIPKKLSEEQLIKICLAPQKLISPPELLRVDKTTFSFKSPTNDFRFLGGYLKRQITPDDIQLTNVRGFPTHVITLFVGYPSGLIKVSSANGRLILRNGYHRVYLLKKRGIKKIPVLVTFYENFESEFPSELHELEKDYVLNHPRPTLMRDFFNEKLTRVFKRKKTDKVVEIKWESTESNIDY